MHVIVVGAGPAGAAAALFIKQRQPRTRVTVIEARPPGATYGWGITLPRWTLQRLEAADPETARQLDARSVQWRDVHVHHQGCRVELAGAPLLGIERAALLEILHGRCRDAGVELRFDTRLTPDARPPCDLLIAADGARSTLRSQIRLDGADATATVIASSIDADSRAHAVASAHANVDTDTDTDADATSETETETETDAGADADADAGTNGGFSGTAAADRTARERPVAAAAAAATAAAPPPSPPSAFGTTCRESALRFVWLGTPTRLPGLTLAFARTPAGPLIAHAYPYADAFSTFVVECHPDVLAYVQAETHGAADPCAYLAAAFADVLRGAPLVCRRSVRWSSFLSLQNARWHRDGVVLLGDAAHAIHFSVGSGTMMAIEDALALAEALDEHDTRDAALDAFEQARRPAVEALRRLEASTRRRLERIDTELDGPPLSLAYSLLRRPDEE